MQRVASPCTVYITYITENGSTCRNFTSQDIKMTISTLNNASLVTYHQNPNIKCRERPSYDDGATVSFHRPYSNNPRILNIEQFELLYAPVYKGSNTEYVWSALNGFRFPKSKLNQPQMKGDPLPKYLNLDTDEAIAENITRQIRFVGVSRGATEYGQQGSNYVAVQTDGVVSIINNGYNVLKCGDELVWRVPHENISIGETHGENHDKKVTLIVVEKRAEAIRLTKLYGYGDNADSRVYIACLLAQRKVGTVVRATTGAQSNGDIQRGSGFDLNLNF